MKENKSIYLKSLMLLLIVILAISTQVFAASDLEIIGLKANIDNEKAYLEWQRTDEASGYEILADIPGRGEKTLGTVLSDHVALEGLANGITYTVKVRAYSEVNGIKVYGDYSEGVKVQIGNEPDIRIVDEDYELEDKVKGLSVKENGTGITASWEKYEGVEEYEIYINIPGKGYLRIGAVSKTYANISGFSSNLEYAIKIRACKKVNGEVKYSDFSDEVKFVIEQAQPTYTPTTKPTYTPTPTTTPKPTKTPTAVPTKTPTPSPVPTVARVTNVKTNVSGTSTNFTWDRVSGATGYEVVVYMPGSGDLKYTSTTNSKYLTGWPIADGYTVKVRAYKVVNGITYYGAYSTVQRFNIKEDTTVAKVTNVRPNVNGTATNFTWDRVNGATGYEIIVWMPGLGDLKYGSTTNSKYLTGWPAYDGYTVKVRAYKTINGKTYYGDYSNIVTYNIKETVAKVTNVKTNISGTATNFTWDKVNGAAGYEVVVWMPGLGDLKYESTTNSKYLTGWPKYDGYTVKVRAYKTVNGTKIYGDYSNITKFNIR